MDEFLIRQATTDDIPFLVETIIEAEKSGTATLAYSTIFGLTEVDVRKYLAAMLYEEVDGCELSISSFLVAEFNGKIVASLSSWIERINDISSSELKGNLLSYVLPIECIKRAASVNSILREIHIDYIPGTIQKGAGYVLKEFRHRNLFGILTEKMIDRLLTSSPETSEVYTQVFGCNIAAIKANEKIGFKIIDSKESTNEEILLYLPSNKKLLLRKKLYK